MFLIKTDPLCAELLVASPEVDEWHRSRKVSFSFDGAEMSSQALISPPIDAVVMSSPKDPRLDSAELPRRQNGHANGSAVRHDDGDENLSSATTSSAASDRSHGVSGKECIILESLRRIGLITENNVKMNQLRRFSIITQ